MRTRSAIQQALDGAVAGAKSNTANGIIATKQSLQDVPSIEMPATPESGAQAQPRAKRKRTDDHLNQPLKGGWDVLPHGMGRSNIPNKEGKALDQETPKHRYNTRRSSVAICQDNAVAPKKGTVQPPTAMFVTTASPTPPMESIGGDRRPSLPEASNSTRGTDDAKLRPLRLPHKNLDTVSAHSTTPAVKSTRTRNGIQNLVVIRGAFIEDNIVVKTERPVAASKIQIFDPDFKPRVKRGSLNIYGLTIGSSPYPHRSVPTAEDCETVHRILTDLHGEVTQPDKAPVASLEVAGCGEVPSVLDALLRTLISGNTLMARADEAIKRLVEKYGIAKHGTGAGSINWEAVRISSLEELTETIKVAGCAAVKGAHIKAILDMVHEENQAHAQAASAAALTQKLESNAGLHGKEQEDIAIKPQTSSSTPLSLDYMHGLARDEAMATFLRYPGIGVKTAACVVLFCLRIPCFAVDTHVHKFCQWLGWVPANATELDSYNHGEFKVPDSLKYALHQLFIRHGQRCYKCRKATRPGTQEWSEAPDCPLEHLLNRGKVPVVKKERPKRSNDVTPEETDSADEASE